MYGKWFKTRAARLARHAGDVPPLVPTRSAAGASDFRNVENRDGQGLGPATRARRALSWTAPDTSWPNSTGGRLRLDKAPPPAAHLAGRGSDMADTLFRRTSMTG